MRGARRRSVGAGPPVRPPRGTTMRLWDPRWGAGSGCCQAAAACRAPWWRALPGGGRPRPGVCVASTRRWPAAAPPPPPQPPPRQQREWTVGRISPLWVGHIGSTGLCASAGDVWSTQWAGDQQLSRYRGVDWSPPSLWAPRQRCEPGGRPLGRRAYGVSATRNTLALGRAALHRGRARASAAWPRVNVPPPVMCGMSFSVSECNVSSVSSWLPPRFCACVCPSAGVAPHVLFKTVSSMLTGGGQEKPFCPEDVLCKEGGGVDMHNVVQDGAVGRREVSGRAPWGGGRQRPAMPSGGPVGSSPPRVEVVIFSSPGQSHRSCGVSKPHDQTGVMVGSWPLNITGASWQRSHRRQRTLMDCQCRVYGAIL